MPHSQTSRSGSASAPSRPTQLYSLVIAFHPPGEHTLNKQQQQQQQQQGQFDKAGSSTTDSGTESRIGEDWRLGEITVDWVDFTREKSVDQQTEMPRPTTHLDSKTVGNQRSQSPGSSQTQIKKKLVSQRSVPGAAASHSGTPTSTGSQSGSQSNGSSSSQNHPTHTVKTPSTPDALSIQPLLAHFPGPNPLDSSYASGLSELGRGVVHLFRHAPPPSLIASIDAHPVGEGSKNPSTDPSGGEWGGDRAEGEDGSLIAILAVPAWMRPADFLEFIGGWGTCLEGVRMIREATTPNRSIVLLKFRDPLQASDFLVIFTGRAFSTLDARETCHPIRIHHLILHKLDTTSTSTSPSSTIAIPAFPPSVYASRAKQLPALLSGVPDDTVYELPSCPVCLERLDSTVTGLVTLPCAHTFDCDCLRKWGDSRCPVCRLSHLLLSSSSSSSPSASNQAHRARGEGGITRLTRCSMCDSTENNWICVVCGVVGCGRYEPQKGHARRHWEESGHVLAMELETQRVWDYNGDNYVHRLIQTRNDGKLVELPSASSLVTSSIPRVLPLGSQASPQPHLPGTRHTPNASTSTSRADGVNPHDSPGPSSNDVEKMSTIESITLEYSYLLSSQLESMRQHYEKQQSSLTDRLNDLESRTKRNDLRLKDLEGAEKAREKAESKADRAVTLSRGLQANLTAEKSMNQGLVQRIQLLEKAKNEAEKKKAELEEECRGLQETVGDLMFTLEAGAKMKELGGEGGAGGDVVLVPGANQGNGASAGKHKKRGKR